MAGLLTTAQVAARLGITPGRVRQLAIEHGIGTKINERTRVFTEEEAAMIDAIRQPVGRPPLAEIAERIVNTGIVTDPVFGEGQAVTVSRARYDQFVAALADAPAGDPLAVAGRALVEHADVADTGVDFPLPAFRRFADHE